MARRSRKRLGGACAIVAASGLSGAVVDPGLSLRVTLMWISACLLAGVVLGGYRGQRLSGMVRRAVAAGAVLPPAALGHFWIAWMGQIFSAPPLRRGVRVVRLDDTAEFWTLLPLTVAALLAATLLILVATLGTTMLTERLRAHFALGPQGEQLIYGGFLIGSASLSGWLIVQAALGL